MNFNNAIAGPTIWRNILRAVAVMLVVWFRTVGTVPLLSHGVAGFGE
jgi:hypothetical protein